MYLLGIWHNQNTLYESNVSLWKKFMASLVMLTHDMLTIVIIWLLLYVPYKIVKRQNFGRELCVLNLACFALVMSFILSKMCILSILYNRMLQIHKCTPYKFLWVFQGELDPTCKKNTFAWLKTSMIIFLMVFVYNSLYIQKQIN